MTKASKQLQDIKRDGIINTATAHARIHEGVYYTLNLYNAALADDASLEMLIQVAADQAMHARFGGKIGGDGELRLFEGTTFSAAGTGLTAVNHNRFSTNTAQGTFSSGPTITGDGTQLDLEYLPGGTGSFFSGGAGSQFFEEYVLQTGEVYLLRMTNRAGAAQPASLHVDFYEPPDQAGVLR